MLLEAMLAEHCYAPRRSPPPMGLRLLTTLGRATVYMPPHADFPRYLAVKGSSSPLDWFQNVRVRRVKSADLLVHAGHDQEAHDLRYATSLKAWREILGDHPIIVGHSAGGSIALGLVLMLGLRTATLVTFGQPRFAAGGLVSALGPGVAYIRVVNGSDLVPRLPFPLVFRHEGELLYLGNDGDLRANPGWWARWWDRWGHFPREYAHDHFAADYVASIRGIYGQ